MRAVIYFVVVFCFVVMLTSAAERTSDVLLNKSPFSDWVSTKSFERTNGISPKRFAKNILAEHQDHRRGQQSLIPVVIIPSLIGSVIEAKLAGVHIHEWYCLSVDGSYFYMWIDDINFVPYIVNCWFNNFALTYNATTGLQQNVTGVLSNVPDYGGVTAIDYLDPERTQGCWNDTIEILTELGYVVGQTLFGAPYDWRTSPVNYFNGSFAALKSLIEHAYYLNSGQKVAVISLSMGGPYFMLFLRTQVSQAWKDKYLAFYTSFDGAFAGSLSAVETMVSEASWIETSFAISPTAVVSLIQSFGSDAWLFPREQVYGNNHVWIETPDRNYTAAPADWIALLGSVNAATPMQMMKDMESLGLRTVEPPGVITHIVHGWNVSTPSTARFNTTALQYAPVTSFGDGDGTILLSGLTWLAGFNTTQYPIYTYGVANMEHGESVHTAAALRIFVELLGL